MDANPREAIGKNFPPLDPPDQLKPRLERDHAELISACAELELERFALPEAPATDAEAAQVTDFVVKLKGVAKRLEDARSAEGRPYLEGQRAVNGFFGAFVEAIEEQTNPKTGALVQRINIYSKAKAEREAAERREQERLQREAAEIKRREEEAQRAEADRLQREAEDAAAAIRQADGAAARAAAEAQMREADAAAATAREAAEKAAEAAAKAERKADTHERAAEGDLGRLSRVSSAGSTSSVTVKWGHAIHDAGKLINSLGPLGAHLSNDAIVQAIGRLMKQAEDIGSIEHLELPGVRFFKETRTNIRASKRA